MDKKFLLTEFLELTTEDEYGLLTEEEKEKVSSGEEVIMSGIMQKADTENGNGRIYPKNILEREVENYKKLVRENRALGQLDHPESAIVELEKVSHVVTHIEMRGNDVVGKIKLLDTPQGRIAKELRRNNIKYGISSRGVGSTKEESGKTMVQDDFQLVCFDLVSEPSTPGAFMIAEGKIPNDIYSKADKINRAINDILTEVKNEK